jgi:uncharacterized membrane protein YcaP (DUF421 family)
MLDQIFGPTGQISWTQECARAAVIFVYGLAVVRLAGRRVFAQWTALDIIVAILTGSTLSRALTGNADLVGTLAATSLLFVLHGVVSHASARSVIASRWLEGGAVRLGANGRIDKAAMRRNAISAAALDEAMRTAGISDPAHASVIVLEPSGRISVIRMQS